MTLFILQLIKDAMSVAEDFCTKIYVDSNKFRAIQK
jgi:hypothetical protein